MSRWKWELGEEEERRVERWRENIAERTRRGGEELNEAYEISPHLSDI